MSRKEFEEWANDFNPMMSGFLKENRAFFETYQAGMESRQPEIDALKADAERYEYMISCIEGVHTEHGARGTGIYTWNLQITEPISVQTEGSLMKSEIDGVIDARLRNQIKGE